MRLAEDLGAVIRQAAAEIGGGLGPPDDPTTCAWPSRIHRTRACIAPHSCWPRPTASSLTWTAWVWWPTSFRQASEIHHAVGDQQPQWRIEPLCLLDKISETLSGCGGAVHLGGPGGDLEASGKCSQVIRAEGSVRCGFGLPGHGQRLARISGGADLAGETDPGIQRLGMSRTMDGRAIAHETASYLLCPLRIPVSTGLFSDMPDQRPPHVQQVCCRNGLAGLCSGNRGLQQLDGLLLAACLAEAAGKLRRNGVLFFGKGALKRLFHVLGPARKRGLPGQPHGVIGIADMTEAASQVLEGTRAYSAFPAGVLD